MVVNIVNKENESSDDVMKPVKMKIDKRKIFHADRLKAIESAIEYREQEEEA